MLRQSHFTRQPTFQPLFGFGVDVARGFNPNERARLVCLEWFLLLKISSSHRGTPASGRFIQIPSGLSQKEAEQKLVKRWRYIDEWKENKCSLVNEVGRSLGPLSGLCKWLKHIFMPSLSGRGAIRLRVFCDALWVLSSVPAIREIVTDLWLSCFVRRHCIEVISSFMLSSSEGYGSLIQHATSFFPADWATGPNVFYHHGALGLCSPNLSTRAANMTNWCGASTIPSHTSILADYVSAEELVLLRVGS